VAGGPHGLHQEQAAAGCLLEERSGRVPVESHRLLAEHVLAGLERQPGVRVVERVRRGDVHDVHRRVADQLLIGAVRRTTELGRELLRPRQRA
jgi:hypothetical protein